MAKSSEQPKLKPLDYATPKRVASRHWGMIVLAWIFLMMGICLIGAGTAYLYLTAGLQNVPYDIIAGCFGAGAFSCGGAFCLRRGNPR